MAKKIGIQIMFQYDRRNKRWWLDVNDLLLWLSERKFKKAKNMILQKYKGVQGKIDTEALEIQLGLRKEKR